MNGKGPLPAEDICWLFPKALSWLRTWWMRASYPFAGFDKDVSVHYSCDISRQHAPDIHIGPGVYIGPDVWLNVIPDGVHSSPKLVLGPHCGIGRRSTISSKNLVVLEEHVLLGPSVLIMDHNHEFADVQKPIIEQGLTHGGKIVIGRNCWLGHSAVIVCGRGELRIGENSVIGANSVVTRSFPPFSVIAGNPARLLKSYDLQRKEWIRACV